LPKSGSLGALKVFPTARRVTLKMEGKRFTGEALVEFASAEAAKQAAEVGAKFCGYVLPLRGPGEPDVPDAHGAADPSGVRSPGIRSLCRGRGVATFATLQHFYEITSFNEISEFCFFSFWE